MTAGASPFPSAMAGAAGTSPFPCAMAGACASGAAPFSRARSAGRAAPSASAGSAACASRVPSAMAGAAGTSPFPCAMAGAADSAARAASPCAAARAKARAASVSMRAAPSAPARRGVISRARTCSGVSDTPRASPRQRMRPASCTATACTGAPCTAMRLPTGPSVTPAAVSTAARPGAPARSWSSTKPPATRAWPHSRPSGVLRGMNCSCVIRHLPFCPGPGAARAKVFPTELRCSIV